MKLPFCRAALLAAALGACLVSCKPAATDEPAAFATAETAEASATLGNFGTCPMFYRSGFPLPARTSSRRAKRSGARLLSNPV